MFEIREARAGRALLTSLCRNDDGQDLVEYSLLMAFFAVALLAVWNSITVGLGLTFTDATTGVRNLWEPPDPGAGP